jgi:AcrR family transcriptional regulator
VGDEMVRQADRTAASVAAIVASARGLFARHGYHDVTIDQVAIGAGVAKGSVYYHFGSKIDLLDHLVDTLQQEIATAVAASARSAAPSPGTLTAGVRAYLLLANRPAVRRIVLLDGPAVLGWKRWREIDDHHFARTVRGGLSRVMPPDTPAAQLDSATGLLMGAIMEAALATGALKRPAAAIDLHCATIDRFISGLHSSI